MDRSLRTVEDMARTDWSQRKVSDSRLIHSLILFLHFVVIFVRTIGRFLCPDVRAVRLWVRYSRNQDNTLRIHNQRIFREMDPHYQVFGYILFKPIIVNNV